MAQGVEHLVDWSRITTPFYATVALKLSGPVFIKILRILSESSNFSLNISSKES